MSCESSLCRIDDLVRGGKAVVFAPDTLAQAVREGYAPAPHCLGEQPPKPTSLTTLVERASMAASVAGPDDSTIRVLLVDDEELAHKVVRRSLRGLTMVSAYNGRQAIERLEEAAVDIVLLDLNMPDISGFDLLVTLQQRWPNLPVVMLSGVISGGHVERAVQLGAVDFLEKCAESYGGLAARLREVVAG